MKKIYGEEEEIPRPCTKAWCSKGLQKYIEEDKFGIYKKENIKMPWFYRFEYNKHLHHRKLMVLYWSNQHKL